MFWLEKDNCFCKKNSFAHHTLLKIDALKSGVFLYVLHCVLTPLAGRSVEQIVDNVRLDAAAARYPHTQEKGQQV